MGGCCCCFSEGVERNRVPLYYYQYPRASEEHLPLSSHHGAGSALSTGLPVDANLETSVPDAYRPPPAPIPFDAGVGHPQTPPVTQEICSNKSDPSVQTTPDPTQETLGGSTQETSAKCDDLKELECKTVANVESAKELRVELSKSVQFVVAVIEEEDVCPTCLEGWSGYTAKEAPRGSSWVTEESSDRSVTESERVLPLSLLSSTLGLIILLQQSKLKNRINLMGI